MSEEKANEIKNSIIKGTLLDEDQVKVTQEIESYFAGSNRNAGPGNLAWFVYVDIKKMVMKI